jgi:hypothetical protein
LNENELILALALALVAIGSAADDDEILQFSKLLISTDEPGLNARFPVLIV